MTRRTAALFLVSALAVTGCSAASEAGSGASSAASASAVAEPSDPIGEAERTRAPAEAPEGDVFTFEQAARFDDGLQVEVSDPRADVAGAADSGAEGTDDQVVVVQVLMSNETDAPFDSSRTLVRGYYGNGVGAPMLTGPDLAVAMPASIPAGQDAQATFAFAVPHAQLGKVTFVVDVNDERLHPPVQFSGRVAAPRR